MATKTKGKIHPADQDVVLRPEAKSKRGRPKEEMTPEQMATELKAQVRTLKTQVKFMASQLLILLKATKEQSLIVRTQMKFQNEELRLLKKSNETVEETLLNVLLAIRQHESMKAWYPAQKGYEEMKVVGIHPAKLEKVK